MTDTTMDVDVVDSTTTPPCKIEERENMIEKMNPREITRLVYELFELYSNLPFMKSLNWKLIDSTISLKGKGGGQIVDGSINFSNLGKSRNLKQYVFNYKITTQKGFWGIMYKKQSFYPLMGWEKRFGEPPSKDELKEEKRIIAFDEFMQSYKSEFKEEHYAVWNYMKLQKEIKIYDNYLSDASREKARTETLKKVIENAIPGAKPEEQPVLETLRNIKRLTSWHIKDEDIKLKRATLNPIFDQDWKKEEGEPRPSESKNDHDILREWEKTREKTTYDKILDKFADTTGGTETDSKQKNILNSVIENRKISRDVRALENTLFFTEMGKTIRGGPAVIAAKIASKQMNDLDPNVKTKKMGNFEHYSFFEQKEGSWNIVGELQKITSSIKSKNTGKRKREEGEEELSKEFFENNFRRGIWLKIELPSVPHAITVIVKDGKIFSAGGGYNDATIAIGGDAGFHYGDFYLYSPDHLFSDWDDQMYNAQNIVGWGFYDNKILKKIEKYEIEGKSSEGYLKVKNRKYCTLANSFFGSNCARFTNDITNKGIDIFYSSPASMAGYKFEKLNDIFFEIENKEYLENIEKFIKDANSFLDAQSLVINTENKETEISKSVKKLLMPRYSEREKKAWEMTIKKDEFKMVYKLSLNKLQNIKNENDRKQEEINNTKKLDSGWPFKQSDRDNLDKLIEKLAEWNIKKKEAWTSGGGRKKRSRKKKKRKNKKRTRRFKK